MRHSIKTSIVIVGLAFSGSLAGCAQTATSESTGTYVDDAAITTKVKAAMFDDYAPRTFEIHAVTSNDVVQLTGFLDSQLIVR